MVRTSQIAKATAWPFVLAAAAAGAWWWWKERPAPPPEYRTARVERGRIVQTVSATGQLEAVVSVEVSSQVSGRILEVLVDFNSEVKRGDVLARLDPATYESAAAQAENELLAAQAALALAQADAKRAQALFAQRLVSDSDLDQIQARLQQAEVAVRIREAALASRKTDLERCTIQAPIDGMVLARNVEMGQTVAASLAAPTLFVIVNDLAKMRIAAPVSEADIGHVQPGLEAAFTVDAFPGRAFAGRVTQVRNAAQNTDGVVAYTTIIEVENPELRLKPGMTANVSIAVAWRDGVLRLPNAALRVRLPDHLRPPEPAGPGPGGEARGPGGTQRGPMAGERRHAPSGGRAEAGGERRPWRDEGPLVARVYRLAGAEGSGGLEAVRVATGITDGSFTEILRGLDEGDAVVTGLAGTAAAGGPAAAQNPFGPAPSAPRGGGRGF